MKKIKQFTIFIFTYFLITSLNAQKKDDLIYKYSKNRVKKGVNLIKSENLEIKKIPKAIPKKNDQKNEIVLNKKKEEDIVFFDYTKKESENSSEIDSIIEELKSKKKKEAKINAFVNIKSSLFFFDKRKSKVFDNYFIENFENSETYNSAKGKVEIPYTLNSDNSYKNLVIKSLDTVPVIVNVKIKKKTKLNYSIPVFDSVSFKDYLPEDINYNYGFLLLELEKFKPQKISSKSSTACKYYFDHSFREQKNIKDAKFVLLCFENGMREINFFDKLNKFKIRSFIQEGHVRYEKISLKKSNNIIIMNYENGQPLDVEEENFRYFLDFSKPIKKSINAYMFERVLVNKHKKPAYLMNLGGKKLMVIGKKKYMSKIHLTDENKIKKIFKRIDAKWNNKSCLIELNAKNDLKFIEYGILGKATRSKDDWDITELAADFIVQNKYNIGDNLERGSLRFYYYFEGIGQINLTLNYKDNSQDFLSYNCMNEYISEKI